MVIGIDARFLTHPQMGGFKTYTENLVNALCAFAGDHSIVVYVDRALERSAHRRHAQISYRVVDGTLPLLGMPVREQITLRRAIARDRIDIMHFPCNTAPVNIALPYVLTLHDTIQLTSPQAFAFAGGLARYRRAAISRYSSWAIRNTAARAARILAVSDYERAQIQRILGVPGERICVTYQGVHSLFTRADDHQRQAWRQELGVQFGLHGRFVLSVGYEPRKQIPLLIEAWSLLARELPGVQLALVASEARSRQHFGALARELGIADRVVLIGPCPLRDLVRLYNLADLFAFPSEREGFGLPLLEAMACGTPVVARDASSLPEVLGDAGILVTGGRPVDWAAAIGSALADRSLRARLAEQGMQRARRFSWQRCAQATMDAYHAAFEQSRRAPTAG